tara:strand:- start:17964 stop:18647 length:684 start_codon:yes stop_codon:yes gene_type:complete
MAPESSTLKKGSRVVVITDLPGVSAGTTGRVGRSIGVKTTRYRVKFDNGVDVLSVAEGKLVSTAAWEFLKQGQIGDGPKISQGAVPAAVPVGAAPAQAPPPATPQPAQTPPETTPPDPPTAKEPEAQAATDSGDASEDPRLAALTAKSRGARKAAGIDVDAEDSAAPDTQTDAQADASEDEVDEPETVTANASEVESDSGPSLPDLPDGYYPSDNRIADLLASVKQG